MTLLKIDHPRRIDQIIDYFGDSRRAGSNDPRHDGGRDVMADHSADLRGLWIELQGR
jgi:hypothetical protein